MIKTKQEFILTGTRDSDGVAISTLSVADAVAAVNAHRAIKGKYFNNNTMNSLLMQFDLITPLRKISLDEEHAWRDKAWAVLHSTEYNFIQGDPTGDLQIGLLDAMIAANLEVDVGGVPFNLTAGLTALRVIALKICNAEYAPYTCTDVEVMAARSPASFVLANHVSDDRVVNPYNSRAWFRMRVDVTSEAKGNIQLAFYYDSTGNGDYRKVQENSNIITIPEGETSFDVDVRVPLAYGANRFWQLKVKAPWDGAITSIVPQVIQK